MNLTFGVTKNNLRRFLQNNATFSYTGMDIMKKEKDSQESLKIMAIMTSLENHRISELPNRDIGLFIVSSLSTSWLV